MSRTRSLKDSIVGFSRSSQPLAASGGSPITGYEFCSIAVSSKCCQTLATKFHEEPCYDVADCYEASTACSQYNKLACDGSTAWVIFSVSNRATCQPHTEPGNAGDCTESLETPKCAEEHFCLYDDALGQCLSNHEVPTYVPISCVHNTLQCP